ncbi:MAG: FlgD immunoglobulin-like domain containing protein [Solirubrobacteraceae bacterium]
MSRFPVLAFWTLIAATVGAFFITQHLKVTTPLITGGRVIPEVLNPLEGKSCGGVDHRQTTVSFYLQHRADTVDVYVVDAAGDAIRTLASARHLPKGLRVTFTWGGHEDNGAIAPDGVYHFQVGLRQQNRLVNLSTVSGALLTADLTTVLPHPVVDSVSPALLPDPGVRGATIRYSGNENRGGTIVLYRTDLPGRPRVVKSFLTPWKGQTAVWDGTINGRPAPAGTYLVGLDVTDVTCNTGSFPVVLPPPPGTTPRAGITVRYLAAQPPHVPTVAGSRATVYVDSRRRPYRWSLVRAGARKATTTGTAGDVALAVPLPSSGAGLYELSVTSGAYRTAVPLVASSSKPQHVLLVMPALTWQGLNPGDEDGDGIPDTLAGGYAVRLERPLANGLPAGIADQAALLEYLDKFHRPYDLTTDLGLIEGVGPRLAGHAAVVLAGDERWLPSSLRSALRSYVLNGGHVLSLGLDSLRAGVQLRGTQALDPTSPTAADALGAVFGPLTRGAGLITALTDRLGIFTGTSQAITAAVSYEPIVRVAPPAKIASQAVTSSGQAPIVGFDLGRGEVVEIALEGFGSSLTHNVDAQELMSRIWTVLSH